MSGGIHCSQDHWHYADDITQCEWCENLIGAGDKGEWRFALPHRTSRQCNECRREELIRRWIRDNGRTDKQVVRG